jgi:hypothetical protein
VYSALRKGLKYAVIPAVRPIEYILTRVEKALKLLPSEMAEEATQEAVRIIKDSSRPRDNWTGAERKVLRALQTTTEHTIFPADKGNSTVVLNRVDYNQKLVSCAGTQLMKDLPGTAQRRPNAKPHFFLRSKHQQRSFANYNVPLVQDFRGYMDSPKFLQKESL